MQSSSSDSSDPEEEANRYSELYGYDRLERGFRIAADSFELLRPGQIQTEDASSENNAVYKRSRSGVRWRVRSQHRRNRTYDVTFRQNVWKCTCPDFLMDNNVIECKHIISCRLTRRVNGQQSALERHVATFDPTTSSAWFPRGSAVYDPATGGFGHTESLPTASALVSWDAQQAAPQPEILADIQPAEAGVALDQPFPPDVLFYDRWAA